MCFLRGSSNSTGCARPLTGKVPHDTKSNASPQRSAVSRDTRMRRLASLVRPSMRLARFTVSPIAVYSWRFCEPISPPPPAPMQADADVEVEIVGAQLALERLQRVGHVERAGDRAPRVVRLVEGRPPHGHDAVADELVERAAMAEHHVDLQREVAVEERDHLLRAARPKRGEAADVGEEQRHLAPPGSMPPGSTSCFATCGLVKRENCTIAAWRSCARAEIRPGRLRHRKSRPRRAG